MAKPFERIDRYSMGQFTIMPNSRCEYAHESDRPVRPPPPPRDSGVLKAWLNEHKDMEKRYESFDTWPRALKQDKLDMITAGFVYSGYGDIVFCHCCCGGVEGWREYEDPWEVHTVWHPTCDYLIKSRGMNFIHDIRGSISGIPCMLFVENRKRIQDVEKWMAKDAEEAKKAASEVGDGLACCKCGVREVSAVSLPCAHISTCTVCAPSQTLCARCGVKQERFITVILPKGPIFISLMDKKI